MRPGINFSPLSLEIHSRTGSGNLLQNFDSPLKALARQLKALYVFPEVVLSQHEQKSVVFPHLGGAPAVPLARCSRIRLLYVPAGTWAFATGLPTPIPAFLSGKCQCEPPLISLTSRYQLLVSLIRGSSTRVPPFPPADFLYGRCPSSNLENVLPETRKLPASTRLSSGLTLARGSIRDTILRDLEHHSMTKVRIAQLSFPFFSPFPLPETLIFWGYRH